MIIFPWGKTCLPPDDRLDHTVAEILLSPSAARERLTEGMHVPVDSDESLGRIEDALIKVVLAEPVERKVMKAVRDGVLQKNSEEVLLHEAVRAGVILSEEEALVRAAIAARNEVIRVDDFPTKRKEKKMNRLVRAFSYH
jgi:acyl-CoA dehydrogenase